MLDNLHHLLTQYAPYLSRLAWFSVIFFLLSILVTPFLVAAIPENYFCQQAAPKKQLSGLLLVRAIVLRGLKNALGLILVLAGLLMLMLPGQGILTLVLGLLLIDYPGKYRFEKKIVSYPIVLNAINWARHKRNKGDLTVSETKE